MLWARVEDYNMKKLILFFAVSAFLNIYVFAGPCPYESQGNHYLPKDVAADLIRSLREQKTWLNLEGKAMSVANIVVEEDGAKLSQVDAVKYWNFSNYYGYVLCVYNLERAIDFDTGHGQQLISLYLSPAGLIQTILTCEIQ